MVSTKLIVFKPRRGILQKEGLALHSTSKVNGLCLTEKDLSKQIHQMQDFSSVLFADLIIIPCSFCLGERGEKAVYEGE